MRKKAILLLILNQTQKNRLQREWGSVIDFFPAGGLRGNF